MSRSTVLWVAGTVVVTAIVFPIALAREGGPFSVIEAVGIGAASGLFVGVWRLFKRAMARSARRMGAELRDRESG